jgi:hypothetical protein
MNSDHVLQTLSASGNVALLTSGSPVFTGSPVPAQGVTDVLVGLTYRIVDDVGITFTWGLEQSADLSTWVAIPGALAVTTLSAAGNGSTVLGFLGNAPRYINLPFIRVLGQVANITNDNVLMATWINVAQNRNILNAAAYASLFAFRITE